MATRKSPDLAIPLYRDPNGHTIPIRCRHDVVAASEADVESNRNCSVCASTDLEAVARFVAPPKITSTLPSPEPEVTDGDDCDGTDDEPDGDNDVEDEE